MMPTHFAATAPGLLVTCRVPQLCRDVNSPAKPLMLSAASSLPPVGELTTLRADIDSAVADAAAYSPSAVFRPTGNVSMPASPRLMSTPTFSQRPTSPFALQSSGDHKGES